MAVSDIPVFSMLRTRMQWHQERQRLLAENVANADTPGFHPRDLAAPSFDQALAGSSAVTLARTEPAHLAAGGQQERFRASRQPFSIRPAGNAVHLEEEMMKVAANQMDYQAASALYGRSLALIKLALGR